MLGRVLKGSGCAIQVIESAEIGTVGVGEATIPPILDFLRFLGIDHDDFVRNTQGTYKLGVKFLDWQRPGHAYWHPFGTFGALLNKRPFYHYWHKAVANGLKPQINDFSLASALGDAGKFAYPDPKANGPLAGMRYALHFDASLVARYLRTYAERLGVKRLERTIQGAEQRDDGFIDALVLDGGDKVEADLFIDCSGFRGLLIEQTLKTGYLDWTHLLPCDRAVALQSDYKEEPAPYTRSIARAAGWQWRIPLQHRAGNGYVYCAAHISDEDALKDLLAVVDEKTLTEPRVLRFSTGRRKAFWNCNCVTLGLASGFLEPLESTSIHLVVSGIYNLIDHFPDKSFAAANTASYNKQMIEEFEDVRDFIIAHYCTTGRTDTPFWNQCRTIAVPDKLAERMELYRSTGRIFVKPTDIFSDLSWFYILDGMGLVPERYDPLIDTLDFSELRSVMASLKKQVGQVVSSSKSHRESLGAARATPVPR